MIVNLCPVPSSHLWNTWSPNVEQAPVFSRTDRESLCITGSNLVQYGKWTCRIDGIEGGDTYSFCVEFCERDVADKNESVHVILTWKSKDNVLIARDYVDKLSRHDEQWQKLEKEIESPATATLVEIELGLRWSMGSLFFRNPVLHQIAAKRHRVIRVATTAMPAYESIESNLIAIAQTIEHAAKEKPDLICLRESVLSFGTKLSARDCAQSIPGPLSATMSSFAKKYQAYIVFNTEEIDGGSIYNTSVLLDRNGNIAGIYRKTHLPLCEAESGVRPGEIYPVFETEFGKVAMLTCYDQIFPETARIMRKNGAELIVIPTTGHAPNQISSRAADNGLFIVVAARADFPGEASCIIDPNGDIVSHVDTPSFVSCTAEIDLDRRYLQYWMSVGPGFGDPKSLFVKERRTSTYGRLTDTD